MSVQAKFTLGLRAAGRLGADVLELESRAAVSIAGTHKRLRAIAACGVTAHDHDLFELERAEVERRAAVNALKAGLGNHGLKIPVITTNLFSHPISKHGVFTNNVGEDCRFDSIYERHFVCTRCQTYQRSRLSNHVNLTRNLKIHKSLKVLTQRDTLTARLPDCW
jgi:hypothetical protein